MTDTDLVLLAAPTLAVEAQYLSSTRYRAALFAGLHARSRAARSQALASVVSIARSWADACYDPATRRGSGTVALPRSPTTATTPPSGPASAARNDDPAESRMLLHLHVLTLIRIATSCPYPDVRAPLTALLRDLRASGVPIPRPAHPTPSCFLAPGDLVPLPDGTAPHAPTTPDAASSPSTTLPSGAPLHLPLPPRRKFPGYGTPRAAWSALRDLADPSSGGGRVMHLDRVLAYFPAYLTKWRLATRAVLRDTNGPVPRAWRLYLAVAAASQFRCLPVAALMRSEYLQAGGDPAWLELGWAGVPRKLAALAGLNAALAHQPWRVTPVLIAALVDPAGMGATSPDAWTVAEIVHAVTVLVTVHAQCSLALGTGVVPEPDTVGGAVLVHEDLVAEVGAVPVNTASVMATAADAAAAAQVVSPAEASLTDQLIARLKESASFSEEELAAGGAVAVESAPNSVASSFVEAEQARRAAFERVETGTDVWSDSEAEQTLPTPYDGATFLVSIPPPPPPTDLHVPQDADAATLRHCATWWAQPGTIPALVAPDLACMATHFTDPADTSLVSQHVDFDVKAADYTVFRLGDWSWEEHGLGLVSKYLGHEVGELLDEAFAEAQHMTDSSVFVADEDLDDFGGDDDHDDGEDLDDGVLGSDDDDENYHSEDHEDHGDARWAAWRDDAVRGTSPAPYPAPPVDLAALRVPPAPTPTDSRSVCSTSTRGAAGIDTAPFREAIWYYVLRLFGMSHDDYNYSRVNHFVNKRTKAFVKKVACAPHTLTYRDWMRMGVLLRPEEKAHVVVLVSEARKQAALVWALSAINKYLDHPGDYAVKPVSS